MRRIVTLQLCLLAGLAAPATAQATRGNVTLTDLAGGLTLVDVLVGAFAEPVSLGAFQFDQFYPPRFLVATARLVGGAVAFGRIATGEGTYLGGLFVEDEIDPLTLRGVIRQDPKTFIDVVGCIVLDPVTTVDLLPRFGTNQQPGYFQACPPGSAVDFSFVSSHVSFAPSLTATPEPASLELTGTALAVAAGVALRRKRTRRIAAS